MSIASSIASSGMRIASLRLQVSARNVANSMSDGPLPGAANAADFPSAYAPQRVDQVAVPGGGVSATVSPVTPSYLPVYDPSAPYADASGMVARPRVDLASEVVQQMIARYSFAANAQVLRADAQITATLLNLTA
jgi:flagellar basal-body rod protein FlgC